MPPEALIEFRRQMEWTQKRCARLLGVSLSAWIKWETGKTGSTIENARALRKMIALADNAEGRRQLSAWAGDDS